ncbi:pyruvate dehydrogenase protein X component-like [Diaphorina citri]|uniref:Pyruvate dehydrogenase protein X component-like n=1 Tax=Diaphorina citri TaxID=121845 RepID=A0A3Q0JKM1_DIACI|nr:pyruvate dehydrogenase protein X component-like [Diaphorina citri]
MYSSVQSDIDKTLALRAQLKSAGITVSVNDFVIKAVALALRQCPLVNCLYTKDEVVSHPSIDISVAVATDNGLITPIVKIGLWIWSCPAVPLPVAPKATSTAAPLGTAAPAPAPSKPLSGYTDIEVSSMRRTIAKRLTESKVRVR